MEEIIKKHNKLKGHIKDPSKLIELINTVVNEAQEEGLFNLQKGGDVEEELCEDMTINQNVLGITKILNLNVNHHWKIYSNK